MKIAIFQHRRAGIIIITVYYVWCTHKSASDIIVSRIYLHCEWLIVSCRRRKFGECHVIDNILHSTRFRNKWFAGGTRFISEQCGYIECFRRFVWNWDFKMSYTNMFKMFTYEYLSLRDWTIDFFFLIKTQSFDRLKYLKRF